jgi:hypothetical protein
MFVGLFFRDWCFVTNIRRSQAYKLVTEPKEVDENTGKLITITGKKLEEYHEKYDFLGVTLRIGEHNLRTSSIALILSALMALVSSFLGPF